ncbi:MAG: SDR family NAD(P)-dependent oxidoreductase [Solirubrobacteraceae bacterium]
MSAPPRWVSPRSRRGAGSRLQLAGATTLVTGASGGLGSAIASALRDRGAELIVSGRRADELKSLAASLQARAVVADLTARQELERLGTIALGAGVDVLVANAALPASGLLSDLTAAEIDRMLEVNLRAPIMLAHELAPAMVARGRGHLVFVSSLSGKAASPASSIYSATKFGLRGFALALRQDLAPHGVGVSLVSPGFIRDAGMFADTGVKLPPGTGTKTSADVAAAVIRAIETGRAELEVAPASLRAGAVFASLAPQLAASASRLAGSARVSAELAQRQRHKR